MRRLTATLLATCLLGTSAVPAIAQLPSPEPPPWFGGRAEMPEYGFAVTVPDGAFAFDLTGDLYEQALSVMATLNPGTPEGDLEDTARAWSDLMQQRTQAGQLIVGSPQTGCTFAVGPAMEEEFDSIAARLFDRWSGDESVLHVEPPTVVDLAAGPAHLVTSGGTGEEVGVYLGKVADSAYYIICFGPERPEDDWLSIAGTFEFLAAEESTPVLDGAVQRVEVLEFDLAMTFPEDWAVRVVMEEVDVGDATLAPAPEFAPFVSAWSVLEARAMPVYPEPGPVGCWLHLTHISNRDLAATLTLDAVLADWDSASTWDYPDFDGSHTVSEVQLPVGTASRVDFIEHDDGDWYGVHYRFLTPAGPAILMCMSFGEAPDDHWLSIAETIEFLPAEE